MISLRPLTRPARKIVHLVAYHPRRTLQPIQHVDQSAPVAGITVSVRADGWQPSRAYLAPDETALDWEAGRWPY